MNIIDRRLNPQGKSIDNRQRFIRRARDTVIDAVREASRNRSITDAESDQDIVIRPKATTAEPRLHHRTKGGKRDYVLPGNKEYVPGDRIARPPEDGSGGGGRGGSGEDSFQFALSRKEYFDLLFADWELPDLVKMKIAEDEAFKRMREGIATTGNSSQLDLQRSARNALGRRIALRRPKPDELAALKVRAAAFPEDDESDDAVQARDAVKRMERRMRSVPWMDTGDLRYRRYENKPAPTTKAVMFCLMDVSGSMDEYLKTLAKDTFTLLYLFLKRKYEKVEVVFIRHTDEAQEVDEKEFFYSTQSGGTAVSSALVEMENIIKKRFPSSEWNVYGMHASDGDNETADNPKAVASLSNILKLSQYYAYIETRKEGGQKRATNVWTAFAPFVQKAPNFAMRRVTKPNEVYPVLAGLFRKHGWDNDASRPGSVPGVAALQTQTP